MSFTALSTSFIVLCSWITVPFTVPFTMQTFAVFLVLLSFGGKVGFSSVLLYLLLGAFGIPVFSSFGVGIGTLLGPSGGFLWGFLLLTLVYLCFERFFAKKPFLRLPALSIGLVICYLSGVAFFCANLRLTGNEEIGVCSAFAVYVLPFVLPDILKMFLAFVLHKRIKGIIA